MYHCLFIDIIPECHLIVSGASNGTVKLFTVAGKCVGTFGQPQSWRSINYYLSENSRGIVPPVLKRSCSPMSTLIMRGKKMNHWNTIKTLLQSSTVGKFARRCYVIFQTLEFEVKTNEVKKLSVIGSFTKVSQIYGF